MPQVPRYNQPQVKQAGLANARFIESAPEGAFGGGAGLQRMNQALGQVSSGVQEIIKEERQKADEIVGLNARKELNERTTRILYGSEDEPGSGVYNRLGVNSFGLTDEVPEQLKKDIDEITAKMTPSQRRAFLPHATSAQMEVHNKTQSHMAVQMQKQDTETTNAFMVTSNEKIARDPFNEKLVGQQIKEQVEEMSLASKRAGDGEDVLKLKTSQVQSNAHVTAVDNMLKTPGGYEKAKNYYDRNLESINTEDRERLSKNLELDTLRGESQKAAERLARSGSRGAALSGAAREFKNDVKLMDATQDRIRKMFADREENQRQFQHDHLEHVARVLAQNGNDLDKVDSKLINSLDIHGKKVIKALAQGPAQVTNWVKYYDVTLAASNPETSDALKNMTIAEMTANFAEPELKKMIEAKKNLLSGDTKFGEDDPMLRRTFLLSGKDATKDKVEFAKNASRYEELKAEQEKEKGKKLSQKQKQELADSLVITGSTPAYLFLSKSVKGYEYKSGQPLHLSHNVYDIPDKYRKKIQADLEADGQIVTDQAIVDLYHKYIRRNLGAPNPDKAKAEVQKSAAAASPPRPAKVGGMSQMTREQFERGSGGT